MAIRPKIDSTYNFSGILIDDLVSLPLLSVVRSESKMSEEQIALLLNNCFNYNPEDNYFTPKVIEMSVTRSVLQPSTIPDGEPNLEQIVTYFNVPLISLFPINALAIQSVKIDFDIDILWQYNENVGAIEERNDSLGARSLIEQTAENSKVEMFGKVAKRKNSVANNVSEMEGIDGMNSSYSIDVLAGPLPLSKGILSIIDLYTSAIDPVEMPEEV
ncbi:DUF2589 domain-containing protein [Aureisphaera galaxeae]|uniref:DUF2589 domain-containing protein n=1 Tax=Aureisphaera galaxeae TaxID=1538023 RepID=UPI00234FBC67|nr:DUF2589 domain-containing protein [Aureisphaera galaxeae]MDC8004703.1 DUF2589 domain-containing protein [Aureisphaera galaxeae]